jgi:hypothetical protein
MITSDIQNIRRADAAEISGAAGDFSTVTLVTDNGRAKIFLPAGTAAAVAACINVAVAAGAQADEKEAARKRWHEVCEAMNTGTWHGTEAEALAEVARCKAIVEQVAA